MKNKRSQKVSGSNVKKKTADITEMLKKIKEVEGWLHDQEQFLLFHLPLLVDHLPGEIVEIGSFKGKSTVALGLGSIKLSAKKRPIYAIDPFTPDELFFPKPYYEDFLNNIRKAGLQNHIRVIKKLSTEAHHECPRLIAALFIDGDHSYAAVKKDILHYTPKVVPGGLIAFHDYSWTEVKPAVDELCEGDSFQDVATYETTKLVRKIKPEK